MLPPPLPKANWHSMDDAFSVSRLSWFPLTNFMVPILGWIYLGMKLNRNKEINSPPKGIRTYDQRLVSNPSPTSLLRLHALVSFCLLLCFFVVGSHHFTRISPYVVQPCPIGVYPTVHEPCSSSELSCWSKNTASLHQWHVGMGCPYCDVF